jgi:hypothetical protein
MSSLIFPAVFNLDLFLISVHLQCNWHWIVQWNQHLDYLLVLNRHRFSHRCLVPQTLLNQALHHKKQLLSIATFVTTDAMSKPFCPITWICIQVQDPSDATTAQWHSTVQVLLADIAKPICPHDLNVIYAPKCSPTNKLEINTWKPLTTIVTLLSVSSAN